MDWIWMPIEQDNDDGTHSPLISIDVLKDGAHFKTLYMEEKWNLFEVRRHLEFEEELSLEEDFYFIHMEKG
jgi:hypothetical protein